MRYDEVARPSPTRGIIIVDSSVLYHTSVRLIPFETDDAKRRDEKVSLNSALSYLSANGFEIIIPEMVAFECAEVIRDGSSVRHVFNAKGPIEKQYDAAHRFLSGVPRMDGNIYIAAPAPEDMTPAAHFVRDVAMQCMSESPIGVKRHSLGLLLRQWRGGQGFGKIAAQQLLLSMKKPNVPVFYCAEGKKSILRLAGARGDVPVHELVTLALYAGMQKENLLRHIGIQDVPEFVIKSYIERQQSERGRPPILRLGASVEFQASLKGLGSPDNKVMVEKKSEPGPSRRMAAFANKYPFLAKPLP